MTGVAGMMSRRSFDLDIVMHAWPGFARQALRMNIHSCTDCTADAGNCMTDTYSCCSHCIPHARGCMDWHQQRLMLAMH